MILTEAQNQIASDLHRFRVINCGRRFGKTTLAVEEIKGKVLSKPTRVCYIAPTYQQARDIAWEMIKKELLPIMIKVNESRLELEVRSLKGESSFIFLRGWESVETLRGQRFDFLVIDEIASMRNFWLNWEEVLRPTLTDTRGEVMFISTPKGFNHFYDLYNLQNKDNDFKSFHFSSYDNPHLPFDELEKAKQTMTEDRFAQEYMADFRKTQGLVYKEFNRDRHIFDKVIYNTIERLAGIDWGYTNPAAVHLVEKDSDRHYWVSNEFYKPQKTTQEIIEFTRSLRPEKVYPDPAEPDRNEEARKAGLNVREVSKDIEAGINCVRELLKQNRLHVHSSCINLIQEFETYMYPDKKPEKNEPEVPIKENDHALDEIRYVLYMQEGKATQNIAHTHYSQSAQPTHFAPVVPNQPKNAYVHIPRL